MWSTNVSYCMYYTPPPVCYVHTCIINRYNAGSAHIHNTQHTLIMGMYVFMHIDFLIIATANINGSLLANGVLRQQIPFTKSSLESGEVAYHCHSILILGEGCGLGSMATTLVISDPVARVMGW